MTGGLAAADVDLRSSEPMVLTHFVAPSTLKQRLMAVDALVVALGIVLAFAWQSLVRSDEELGVQRPHLVLAFVTFPVWIGLLLAEQAVPGPGRRAADRGVPPDRQRLPDQRRRDRRGRLRRSSSRRCPGCGSVLRAGVRPVLLVVERTIARRIFTRMRRAGQICRPILIVGTDADAVGLLHAAQRTPAPRLPGRRLRRPRRHRRPWRRATCSAAIDDDRGGPRGDRRHRRADLAVVGRVRRRQPAHPSS